MKWRSTLDELPGDQEEVLIRNGGKYNLATFIAEKKAFRLRSGDLVKASHFVVQWTRLVGP